MNTQPRTSTTVAELATAALDPFAPRQTLNGEILRVARLDSGASLADVAAAVGVSSFTVFRWESGAHPQPRFVARVERVQAHLSALTNGGEL